MAISIACLVLAVAVACTNGAVEFFDERKVEASTCCGPRY